MFSLGVQTLLKGVLLDSLTWHSHNSKVSVYFRTVELSKKIF